MSFFLIQILTGLASASVLFLIASGLTIIFGVTRILNFAHGSFYMLGAYVAYSLTRVLGGGVLGFWGSLALAAVLVGLFGLLIEMFILRRIYHAPELLQLLATFGMVLMIQDLALHVWGPEDLLGPQAPGLQHSISLLGESFPLYDLFLIGLALVALGVLWILFYRTRWGVLVRAATQDREMVAALGIHQKKLFSSVFLLGSLLAGLGGALQLPRESVSLSMDSSIIIEVFAVIVIGGMGSLAGAFWASILIGLAQAFGILIFPQITLVVVFLVMAVVLVFKQWGLLGKPEDHVFERGLLSDRVLAPIGRKQRMLWGAVMLALVALPWMTGEFGLVLVSEVLIFALFAASLHFVMGPGGLGSFGHALYFGCGAYAVALLTKYAAVGMGVKLAAAPLAAMGAGLIFGWFCVRSSGIYLAMLTFAFAQIVWAIAFQWYDVTGGDNGLLGIWPDAWATDRRVFYYLVLALCGISVVFLRRVVFSPFGYAIRAVRDNRKRAEAIGINHRKFQWLGLIISGAFAGLAGGLYAYSKGSVFPTVLDMQMSVDAFVMCLLGGITSLSGPLVGAAVYTVLESEISRHTQLWRACLGGIILLIVMLFPSGIVGCFQRIVDRWKPQKPPIKNSK